MKLFISQPMAGKTEKEILNERNIIIKKVKETLGEEIEIIDSFIEETPSAKNIPLWYLGKSIELLSNADIAYFVKGWENNRGCRIEYDSAKEYGIDIIEEKED